MKKHFLIDTNVLVYSPGAIEVFQENDVSISSVTLEELDSLKTQSGDIGFNARECIRKLNDFLKTGDPVKGVRLKSGGLFRVISINDDSLKLPYGWNKNKPENIILKTAALANAILVTNDPIMVAKAKSIGVSAEKFSNEDVSDLYFNYTGRTELFVPQNKIEEFYDAGFVSLKNTESENNEFVILKNMDNEKQSALACYDAKTGLYNRLRYLNSNPFGVTPKNVGQKFAIEALMAPANEVPLVILKGPAGTAKTFLSIAAGLEQVVEQQIYNKLLLFRPNIKFDEDIGYLKGGEMEKIRPLMRPCFDNMEALLCDKNDSIEAVNGKIDYLFKKGYVGAEALAYLRGRSIKNTFILIDEAQNSTKEQMLGIITRAGEGSKIVIVGDPDQVDNPKIDKRNNGLVCAAAKMLSSDLCMQLTFSEEECVRSPLAKAASLRMKN